VDAVADAQVSGPVGLSANWLDATTTVGLNDSSLTNHVTLTGWWNYPWYSWPYYSVARPVKLAMSEVEYLRGIARKDKKLRAILGKFTEVIEVTVDFE
jgi:hypothetical protein